jgi:hypothetical protein
MIKYSSGGSRFATSLQMSGMVWFWFRLSEPIDVQSEKFRAFRHLRTSLTTSHDDGATRLYWCFSRMRVHALGAVVAI